MSLERSVLLLKPLFCSLLNNVRQEMKKEKVISVGEKDVTV
jgi:hypothetical protein